MWIELTAPCSMRLISASIENSIVIRLFIDKIKSGAQRLQETPLRE